MVRARHPLDPARGHRSRRRRSSRRFLVNDTICLVMTPLVLDLVRRLKRNPVPYLLAVAMASNAGSVATITGNPQNMIIGSLADIPYARLRRRADARWRWSRSPLTVVLIAILHPKEFLTRERLPAPEAPPEPPQPAAGRQVARSSSSSWSASSSPASRSPRSRSSAARSSSSPAGSRRRRSISTSTGRCWSCSPGLFIVVAGFDKAVIGPEAHRLRRAARPRRHPGPRRRHRGPLQPRQQRPRRAGARAVRQRRSPIRTSAWLVVAMAATLAGNLTLVASVANLIVARRRGSGGVTISFWAHFRVGAPMTLLSLAFGIWWLS